jgi:hypothetical protein
MAIDFNPMLARGLAKEQMAMQGAYGLGQLLGSESAKGKFNELKDKVGDSNLLNMAKKGLNKVPNIKNISMPQLEGIRERLMNIAPGGLIQSMVMRGRNPFLQESIADQNTMDMVYKTSGDMPDSEGFTEEIPQYTLPQPNMDILNRDINTLDRTALDQQINDINAMALNIFPTTRTPFLTNYVMQNPNFLGPTLQTIGRNTRGLLDYAKGSQMGIGG